MPKVLSLKKPSTTNKQKSITQFFKCESASTEIRSPTQDVAVKNFENKEIKQSVKRKAESPIKSTSSFFSDKSKGTDFNISLDYKKPKSESKLIENDIPHTCSLSNKKNNDLCSFNGLGTSKSNNYGINNDREHRIPLSPVKQDNNIIDKTGDHKYNVNDISSTKNIRNNTNSKIVNETLKKSSSFNNRCLSPSSNMCGNIYLAKKSPSPKKRSPSKTPEKYRKASLEFSPSKHGSTVKILTFSENDVEDIFNDDWDISNDIDVNEDLDLSTMQRCQIVSVTNYPSRLELKLQNDNHNTATCFIEGVWLNTPLKNGDIISILATRNASGQFVLTSSSGLLVLRPDYLMSSTSVVAGVFCKRKAVLQERYRGIDSANTAMTIGTLVHELVQAALTRRIVNIETLRLKMEAIITQSTQILYDAGLSVEETRANMQSYVRPLAEFMQRYVVADTEVADRLKDRWTGHIDEVLDIEENVCCPQLGLKGKIDATLQVTIHERTGRQHAAVPLELKTGKPSMSAEHRGQLVLYCMMMGLQRGEDPATALQRGLLLYLKDKSDLREVSCGYPERRDLMMLRNELVQHLAEGPTDVDEEQLIDIEDASNLLHQSLPEPVHHENACAKCPYLTVCSLHLWHTKGPAVSEKHPLTKLRGSALGHLNPEHIRYFLHWTCLLRLEEKEQMRTSPLHSLWTDSSDNRSKRGTCSSNLILKTVTPSGDRFDHVFEKKNQHQKFKNNRNGPQQGEFSIVSIENRPWIAAGVVTLSNENEICITLERDLSCRLDKHTVYHIDTYESYATTVHNLTNLGVLMEDSDRALRMRRLIIDREIPVFSAKLHRSVGRLGAKLMRSLNIDQQRAVLRALAAEDYVLLQGLPGTGKTQTISVLIQMLVGLQQRVLVTAHTHSAVDTVLMRLPVNLRVMRLGSSSRVAPGVRPRCEDVLVATCTTPELLSELYASTEVVGVTCLGAAHAMLARTTFDVCIVDEATQVLQSTVLRPLFASKRFVLVGDPEQLPPVVRSRAARRLGMEESLFHRLMSEHAVSTLRLQYRMNQPLVDVANRVAYSDRLKCANQIVAQAKMNLDFEKVSSVLNHDSWLLTACSPDPALAAIFVDMPTSMSECNEAKNLTNIDEACVVLAVVDTLKQGGVLASDIGVIAPYRDQVALLRRALEDSSVEVSTVDQFQGRDKSVIVYSCSKRDNGKADKKVKEGEVLNDQRRLAVSVTRAKHKLVVIGNKRALRPYDTLQPLIEACHSVTLQAENLQQLFDKFKILLS